MARQDAGSERVREGGAQAQPETLGHTRRENQSLERGELGGGLGGVATTERYMGNDVEQHTAVVGPNLASVAPRERERFRPSDNPGRRRGMEYLWLKALHVFGAFLWFAGLMTALNQLRTATIPPPVSPEEFQRREGAVGRVMDAGAGIAIAAGLVLLLQSLDLLKGSGFMHAKLTLALALVGLHGMVRVKLKRFRTGRGTPLPGFVLPATVGAVGLILVLILVRPF